MPPSFIPHFQMKNPQTGPVADDIGTVGEILFCGKQFSQKKWVELVHNDGK